jgi:hypothetical protein
MKFNITKSIENYSIDGKPCSAIWYRVTGENLINTDTNNLNPSVMVAITEFVKSKVPNILKFSCYESSDYDGSIAGMVVAPLIDVDIITSSCNLEMSN